ncbi:MAG: porin [Planctomycetota bacterium]
MKKTVSRLALAAAVAGLSTSAMAADLGGSCCADLEERIAELEATTARKGNRVMSLRISGSIGQRVVWHDADGDDARRPDKLTIEDFDDGGDLRFSGSAKLSSDISVGFRMSFDPNDNGDDNVDDLYIYVESKRLGSVFVGRVDSAFDGINRISLADIEDIMLDDAGLDGVGNGPGGYFGDGYFFFEDLDGDDAEGGTIRYVSPTLHGFVFSASYSNDADEADEDTGNTFDGEEIWAVALRYAGEFNGIRIAAGIGYEDQQAAIANAAGEFVDREIVTGSISVMHAPTGLFVNFAAGEREDSNFFGATGTDTLTHYGFVVGVERKFIALGKSTFYGHVNWGEFESTRAGVDDEDGVDWGLGYVQSIDAAASRFNVQYLRKECVDDSACDDDANVLYSGFVVSF